jgi:hypothetical protein
MMDTEAIASEIVELKNRIAELDDDVEADRTDERVELHDRMRELQDRLAAKGDGNDAVPGTQRDEVQYIAPA